MKQDFSSVHGMNCSLIKRFRLFLVKTSCKLCEDKYCSGISLGWFRRPFYIIFYILGNFEVSKFLIFWGYDNNPISQIDFLDVPRQ